MQFAIYVKKLGESFAFDTATLPQSTIDYACNRALSDYVNDEHANVVAKDWTGTAEEFATAVRAKVDPALDNVRTGKMPMKKGMVAMDAPIVAALKKAGIAALTPEQIAVVVATLTAKQESAAPVAEIIPPAEVVARRQRAGK